MREKGIKNQRETSSVKSCIRPGKESQPFDNKHFTFDPRNDNLWAMIMSNDNLAHLFSKYDKECYPSRDERFICTGVGSVATPENAPDGCQ